MIIDGTLSLSQKERDRKNYNRFNLINGLSYMCLGETVIILFAMRMNCPDFVVSALGAFLFLGNFAMPFGKMVAARTGASSSVSMFWVFRNIAAMLVASASLVYRFFGQVPAIALVMIGAFLFYSCRSAGTVVMQPLIGEITTKENRGSFISKSNQLFYFSCLLCLAVITCILKFYQDLWTLSLIIFIGSAFGFTSAVFLARIVESGALRNSAREPMLQGAWKTLKDKSRRRLLTANFIVSALTAMTIPISMLAIKRGYGISDTNALIFAVVQFCGAVAISYVIGILSGETGPRPILLLSYAALLILCGCWIFSPPRFHWQFMAFPFFLGGVAANGTSIALTQYFLLAIPARERMVASLTIYVVSGIFAGLVAMILGGALLSWIGTWDFGVLASWLDSHGAGDVLPLSRFSSWEGTAGHLNVYRIYFLAVSLILLCGFLPLLRLKPYSRWRVGDVLGLAFAPRDLLTLYNLHRFNQLADAREEEHNIDLFQESHSELSERALLSSLDSPKLALRGRALLAIGELPLSRDAEKAVLHELETGEHTTANIAAQICGTHGMTEAIPMLRAYLSSTSDYYLKSKAMLALTQLRDRDSYPEIRRIFEETDNPRLIMHGAAALVEIGTPESFSLLLRKTFTTGLSDQTLSEILCSAAELAGYGDDFYKFIKLHRKDPLNAIQMFSEFCCTLLPDEKKADFAENLLSFESGKIDSPAFRAWMLSMKTLSEGEEEEEKSRNEYRSRAFLFLTSPEASSRSISPIVLCCLLPLFLKKRKKKKHIPFSGENEHPV